MATSSLSSQISCFSSIINRQHKLVLLGKPSSLIVAPSRFKFSVSMHVDGNGTQASTSETETTLRHGGDTSKLHVEGVVKPYPVDEEPVAENPHLDETIPDQEDVVSHKKTAKIHDFCLGIPFGGLVLSGGLVGSVFSRNLSTLGIGMVFGGGVLALSAWSFKGWRQGKSTMPFILGQAALSAVLLWKQLQTYFMTKKVFPSGFYALISAAMFCFYSYVMASGGNPPPKKLKGPWGNPTGKEVEVLVSPYRIPAFQRQLPVLFAAIRKKKYGGEGNSTAPPLCKMNSALETVPSVMLFWLWSIITCIVRLSLS